MYSAIDIDSLIKIYDKPKKLHSGGKSRILFDVQEFISIYDNRKYLIDQLSSHIYKVRNDLWKKKHSSSSSSSNMDGMGEIGIVGIETGGALIGAMLATMHNCDFFVYKKSGSITMPKEPQHRDLIIVDDVVTTGASMIEVRQVLERMGHLVHEEMCVIDRRNLNG